MIFGVLLLLSLCAELINDKPLLVRYEGQTMFLLKDYPETVFGGDFETPTDYLTPSSSSNCAPAAIGRCFNRYGAGTINYFAEASNPAPPSAANWLGRTTAGATCWRN